MVGKKLGRPKKNKLYVDGKVITINIGSQELTDLEEACRRIREKRKMPEKMHSYRVSIMNLVYDFLGIDRIE